MKAKGDSFDNKVPVCMCDCTVDSDVGTGNFSLVQGILHICGHTHMRWHMLQGMDCCCHIYIRQENVVYTCE